MPTYDAGDARLRIVPDAREFRAKLESDLKRIRVEYAVNVSANTAQAAADIRRFRDVEQRNDLRVGVDVALAQAHADMARFRALQQADRITIPVDVDRNSLARARSSISAAFAGVGGNLLSGIKWNAGAAGIALLPTMATGLASVTSALQELSQAGLIMPGIMAAAGASIGTVMLGTSGLKDTFKELGKQDGTQKELDKLNEQLAKLSPNARSFAHAVIDLKPAFTDLQQSVQDNLFAGIGDQLRVLADQDLPTFKAGLGGIATALSHNLGEVMRVLGTDQSRGLFDRILGNTSDAQERFTAAIEPLLNGLGTLSAAGTDVLPRLADGFGKAAERFNKFITAADSDGRLDTWINDGIDGLTHLGNTFINIGKSLGAVTTAFGGGDGLLSLLERGTNRLQTFLNSAQGQDMLKRVFEEGRTELDKWMPILSKLPDLFGKVLDASQMWTSVLLPTVNALLKVINTIPGGVQTVVTAFLAWKTITGVTSLATSLKSISSLLSVTLPGSAATGRAGISAALAGVGAEIAGVIASLDLIQNHLPASLQGREPNINKDLGPNQGKGLSGRSWSHDFTHPWEIPQRIFRNTFGPDEPSSPSSPTAPTPGTGAGGDGGAGGQKPTGYRNGGPTQSGRGNGPTGGWISELHEDEWVVNARGRANLGDTFLAGVNAGKIPGFIDGGFIDMWGNPITAGPLPGTGIANSFGSFLGASGLSNPLSVGGGTLPGLGGRSVGSGGSSDAPQDFAHQWFPWLSGFEKTGDPFANAPAKIQPQNIAYQFGQTLLGGVLGGLGLNQSILSPTNRYNQAAQQTAGFYFNKFGGGATSGGAAALSNADVASRLTSAGFNPDQINAVITSRDETARHDAMESQLANLGLSSTDIQAAMKAAGGNGKAPAANYNGGSDALHNTVYKAFIAAGFPNDQWPDMVNLINGESSWNPKAKNPSSTAYGLGQFLDSTWAIVGGTKTSNAAEQARLMMAYIAATYHGSPSEAYNTWLSRTPHWYAVGGPTPGSTSTPIPAVLHGGEFVQRARAVAKYGIPFMAALNEGRIDPAALPQFAVGGLAGDVLRGIVPPTPADPKVTPLAAKNPQPAGPGKQIEALRPPANAAPIAPAPQPHLGTGDAPGPERAPSQQKDQQKPVVAPQVSAAPSSYDHELPALKTAVSSTASTIGSLVQSASGAAPFPGAGEAGAIAAGAIKQAGKIVNDVINIPSSFLVGNITPGTQDSAYGSTLASPMRQPATAPTRVINYGGFYGHNTADVLQELDLRSAQDQQAALAARPR